MNQWDIDLDAAAALDEKDVPDYFLQLSQTKLQSAVDVEAYPKAGAPNPIAEVFTYDVVKGTRTKMDVRDGRPFTDIPADGSKFTNDNVGHYVYYVRWSPDARCATDGRVVVERRSCW